MTSPRGADVLAVGLATPLGLSSAAAAAAIRAGLCRFRESEFADRNGEPQVLSRLAPQYLPPILAALPAGPGNEARDRMLQLGACALAEAAGSCPVPAPAFIALPEDQPGAPPAMGPEFVRDLAIQAEVKLDLAGSRVHREGGAAGHAALDEALALLASGRSPFAIVGGVDSFVDRDRLEWLDEQDRLLGSSQDGFVPGEGAGFVLLAAPGSSRRFGLEPLARVTAVGLGKEPGHRGSTEPCRGDGLTAAVRASLERGLAGPQERVRTIYAGLNGESLGAKEWSIAYLRNADRFDDDHAMEHPADCIGDAGAALGPILLGLAVLELRAGRREAPCLVWSASDGELRGAAVLRPSPHP